MSPREVDIIQITDEGKMPTQYINISTNTHTGKATTPFGGNENPTILQMKKNYGSNDWPLEHTRHLNEKESPYHYW